MLSCPPRRILSLPGGEHLAEDDIIDIGGGDAGLRKRRLDRDAAELVRGGRGEGTEKAAYRGALGGGDDDVCHDSPSSFAAP